MSRISQALDRLETRLHVRRKKCYGYDPHCVCRPARDAFWDSFLKNGPKPTKEQWDLMRACDPPPGPPLSKETKQIIDEIYKPYPEKGRR